MEGQVNIDALKVRQSENKLNPSDHPMLGLIALADLEIDQIINSQNTQELKNQLEGAGNYLSRQILKYWSQNKHISLRFDVRPGKPGDPPGARLIQRGEHFADEAPRTEAKAASRLSCPREAARLDILHMPAV